LTRAGYQIYQRRPDLQLAMPKSPGDDEDRLIAHLAESKELHTDLMGALQEERIWDQGDWAPLPIICCQLLWSDPPIFDKPARQAVVNWFNDLQPLGEHRRSVPRLLK